MILAQAITIVALIIACVVLARKETAGPVVARFKGPLMGMPLIGVVEAADGRWMISSVSVSWREGHGARISMEFRDWDTWQKQNCLWP